MVKRVFTHEEMRRFRPDRNIPVGEYVRIPVWAIGRKVQLRNRVFKPGEMQTVLFESVIENRRAQRYAYRIVDPDRSIVAHVNYVWFQSPVFNNGNPCGVNLDIKDEFITEVVSRLSLLHPGEEVVVKENEYGIKVNIASTTNPS